MGFSQKGCWSGLPCPPPGHLPDPGIEPVSPEIPALQSGKSYAVWGVYTKLESAEKYIKWLADNYPEIEAKIYLYDSRYMVALCEVSSRNACGNKVSAWKKQHKSFKDVWVYTR